MSKEKKYDVIVVGGGPGGYTAAFRAADLGLSVCLVEEHDRLGGVCLNVGCIPSKTLLHGAAVIEEAEDAAEFGISFGEPTIDIDKLKAKKESIVAKLTGGLDGLCKARKVTRKTGYGRFAGDNRIRLESGVGEELSFAHCIIATGSHAVRIPSFPDDERIWDSTDALSLENIPGKLLIVGGGIIGLEMAQVYGALGAEITIVEMMDHIIPPADKDMVQPLFQKIKKKYRVMTKTKVTRVEAEKDGIRVTITGKKSEEEELFDAVLVAVGRKPNSDDLGLESVGLAVDEQGFIAVNEHQRTANPAVYAIGDVVGEPMLAHKATHQGKVAAEVIAGKKSAFTPLTIPSVAYTSPELAWMGVTEKEAKEKGIEYDKGKFAWGASGRALTAGSETGASKAIFSKETGRLIGAAICGQNAGELIHEAILALEMGADAEDISKTIHAHPTLAETFAFAAEIVDGSITDALPPKKK